MLLAACGGTASVTPSSASVSVAGSPSAAVSAAAKPSTAASASAAAAASTEGSASAAAKPAASAAASTAPAASGLVNIAVSYPEGGAHVPLWYAQEKGIFAKHGLNVDLKDLGGGPPAAAALSGNQVQIVDISGSSFVSLDAAGGDIIALATLDPVYPYVLEVPANIKTPQDLKGQGIAVRAFGDATDIAARAALQQLGLKPDVDVKLVEVNTEGARLAAVQAGKICCTVAQPQDALTLEPQGYHPLFDFSKLQGAKNAQGVIAVTRSYATSNKQVVQEFMDALIEAIPATKADKPGAVALIKKYLKIDDDKVANTLYDYFIGSNLVPNNPVVSADQFQDGINILSQQNDKLKGFTMDKFIDTSFLQAAVAKTPAAAAAPASSGAPVVASASVAAGGSTAAKPASSVSAAASSVPKAS
jgi:NitT/TauT family transport system substrate-binding protein